MKKENLWQFSKNRGAVVEDYVLQRLFPSIGLKCTKNNGEDVKEIDLMIEGVPLEVKTAFTPYPKTPTPAKLTAEEHLTLDAANIAKYPREALLLFLVRYDDKPKVCFISAGRVKDIVANIPYRIYTRSGRSLKDKRKKIGIAFEECIDITHCFHPDVLNEMKSIP